MTMRNWFIAVAALVAGCSISQGAFAQNWRPQAGRWEPLGCVDVGIRPDRDIIKVGMREGRFKAIRLSAQGNDVYVLDLKVRYGGGAPDDIQVRAQLDEGKTTRPLDLKGGDRFIDSVELVTKRDFKGRNKGRAKVCVSGLDDDRWAGPGPGRPDKWEELGCQKVGFLGDRDVVKVGRREGRFKAIRLLVSGNSVYIVNLKVVYANGAPDDIDVKSEIREGGQSGALDLKGRDRAIDRVELVYRAKPNFNGSARVCVQGLG
jgi:hypothetical protein